MEERTEAGEIGRQGFWTVRRTGGVDQIAIKSEEDILSLARLDKKLWAVLSIPTGQPRLGEALGAIDTDKDGRIRVSEVLSAIQKAKDSLVSLQPLFERTDSIRISQLSDAGLKEAAALAREMLDATEGDAPDANAPLSISELRQAIAAFNSKPFNGDGVLVPECAEDGPARALIARLVEAGYGTDDRSGTKGLDLAGLERFHADAAAYLEWLRGPGSAADRPAALSGEARSLFVKLHEKLDDYFLRCSLLEMAQGEGNAGGVAARVSELVSASGAGGPGLGEGLEGLPLAMPSADATLNLSGALNPYYDAALKSFFSLAVQAGGEEPVVDAARWETVKADMLSRIAFEDSKPALAALYPDAESLAALLESDAPAAIRGLVEKDLAIASRAAALSELENLLVLKRDLVAVLENFVNMDGFYKKAEGVFQTGRLFIDGRELSLCLDVKNPALHSSMAGLSSIYLIYCDLIRAGAQNRSIVCALTAGESKGVFVGRKGLFYDSEGLEWDASVAKIVVQPISVREAFLSPYRWLARTIEEFSMKRAQNAEAAAMNSMKSVAGSAASAGSAGAKPVELPVKKMDVGTVAAIGVALGSIGAMVTGILTIFLGLGVWMPVGIVAIFLLISGPSMILAYMKLRKRNIGPLLNAEGWAVNAMLKINIPFGASLSRLAQLPKSARREVQDPYAAKHRGRWLVLAVLLLVAAAAGAYFLGWLDLIFTAAPQ